jgi:hypothetical protein
VHNRAKVSEIETSGHLHFDVDSNVESAPAEAPMLENDPEDILGVTDDSSRLDRSTD